MARHVRIAALGVSAAAAFCGSTVTASGHSEPPPVGEIVGLVSTAASAHRHAHPLKGVTVTVANAAGVRFKSLITPRSGSFTFRVAAGRYKLTARRGLHACPSKMVTVRQHQATHIHIVCPAA